MIIDIFFKEVLLVSIRCQLSKDKTRTFFLSLHFDHIFFDQSFLELHEIVDQKIGIGLALEDAIVLMFYQLIIIDKLVTCFEGII